MNKDQKKTVRRTYFIYPKFQFSLIAMNVSIIVGVCTPILLSIIYSFRKLRQMGTEAGIQSDHVYFKFLALQESLLKSSLGIALICGILISTLLSVIISHKVAGPLIRLRAFFKDLAKTGKLSPVNFRKGDFFNELPDEINQALSKLHNKP
jgi:hypothetical protein